MYLYVFTCVSLCIYIYIYNFYLLLFIYVSLYFFKFQETKKTKYKSILLTFFPHPRHVLQKDDQEMKLINTLNERQELLKKAELDNLIIHQFTKEFSRIKSANFVRDILVEKLNVHTLVIGYDHHFGRNREGTFADLVELSSLYDYKINLI